MLCEARAPRPGCTRDRITVHLRVNPLDCIAHGLCAELLPEWVRLDESGYPLLADGPLPAALVETARRAAQACPTRALLLEPDGS